MGHPAPGGIYAAGRCIVGFSVMQDLGVAPF
jgi:hypothetical protein